MFDKSADFYTFSPVQNFIYESKSGLSCPNAVQQKTFDNLNFQQFSNFLCSDFSILPLRFSQRLKKLQREKALATLSFLRIRTGYFAVI